VEHTAHFESPASRRHHERDAQKSPSGALSLGARPNSIPEAD
jgi:hypothetical protein